MTDLQRIAMVIEFDGSHFHGWQQQENALSVQSVLQDALGAIEQRQLSLVAAGRTDAGVHAEALLVHADVSASRWQRSHRAYVHGCNNLLPASVRVTGVRQVEGEFHARFDCRERRYRYQIWNRSTAPALEPWRHWWMPRPLDIEAMRQAAGLCLGRHDFSALRASGCQASGAVRTVREIGIQSDGYSITFSVAADAFLYHMVRNLVGNLVEVGIGKRSVDEMQLLLSGGDRSQGAATAPAHGLYFTDAVYDEFRASELVGQL